MTLNNATVSIYGGQTYTVRLQLKNITTLVPGECVNILKCYCKVCYHVECLGHNAFILEFYIAFDIFLISRTGDCFINKLKLRDPLKVTRQSLQYDYSGFLPIHQCNVDTYVRVSDAR